MLKSTWRIGGDVAELLLDLAAGRPLALSAVMNDEAFALCHQHGLMGLLAMGPAGVLSSMARPSFARLTARQQVMVRHLQRVLHEFDDRGIRAAVLKGPYLARYSYREPAHRTFTDIDVLVHPADLKSALEALTADPAVSAIPAQGPKADKRNILMFDPHGVRFTLDLHWDLFSYKQLQGSAMALAGCCAHLFPIHSCSTRSPISTDFVS
jgi:hypothetical protein